MCRVFCLGTKSGRGGTKEDFCSSFMNVSLALLYCSLLLVNIFSSLAFAIRCYEDARVSTESSSRRSCINPDQYSLFLFSFRFFYSVSSATASSFSSRSAKKRNTTPKTDHLGFHHVQLFLLVTFFFYIHAYRRSLFIIYLIVTIDQQEYSGHFVL